MKIILIKNITILIVSIVLCYLSSLEIKRIPINLLPDVASFVGFTLVAPLFANFAFTYSDHGFRYNLLGHIISFLVMLPCIVMIGILDLLFIQLAGNLIVFRIMLLMFVVSIFLYDIWDAVTERGNVINES